MNKLINFLLISQPFVAAGRRSILQDVQQIRDVQDVPEVIVAPSPPTPSLIEESDCPSDVKACEDGSFVSRDVSRNCEFNLCPELQDACPDDVFTCWDNSVVSRDGVRDCVFRPCPLRPSEVEVCDEKILTDTKEHVANGLCMDGCDCMREHITSLARLSCVIPDDIMEKIELKDPVISKCDDIQERKNLLRDTQNECRSGMCELRTDEIDDLERHDDEVRKETELEVEPVRDVDDIQKESEEVRHIEADCLVDCDYDGDVCSILKQDRNSTERLMKECGDRCDAREIKEKLYESCSKMDRNTIDAAMDFYGDESSARMLTIGALVFLFQIIV